MPPNMQPEMPMGRSPMMQPEMPMGRNSNIQPEMPMGRNSMMQPEMPVNSGTMNSSCNIDQFPVAMAYVPWQHWQQVYPVDKAINRGTIFPDLDKPFSMGRCR